MSFVKSIFGGGDKKPAAPPPKPAPSVSDEQQKKKKRLGRASLIATSPGGDLSPVNTAGGKILGN